MPISEQLQYQKNIKVLQVVEKEIGLDYGHRLPNHIGQCRYVHGHRAKIVIGVEGHLIAEEGVSSQGMVVDFKDIKKIAMKKIHDVIDHGFIVYKGDKKMLNFLKKENQKYVVLNDIPTAENISRWCYYQIKEDINRIYKGKLCVKYVKFWETPSSMTIYQE